MLELQGWFGEKGITLEESITSSSLSSNLIRTVSNEASYSQKTMKFKDSGNPNKQPIRLHTGPSHDIPGMTIVHTYTKVIYLFLHKLISELFITIHSFQWDILTTKTHTHFKDAKSLQSIPGTDLNNLIDLNQFQPLEKRSVRKLCACGFEIKDTYLRTPEGHHNHSEEHCSLKSSRTCQGKLRVCTTDSNLNQLSYVVSQTQQPVQTLAHTKRSWLS